MVARYLTDDASIVNHRFVFSQSAIDGIREGRDVVQSARRSVGSRTRLGSIPLNGRITIKECDLSSQFVGDRTTGAMECNDLLGYFSINAWKDAGRKVGVYRAEIAADT